MFQISYTIRDEPIIHYEQYYTREAAELQLNEFADIFTHFHSPNIEVVL